MRKKSRTEELWHDFNKVVRAFVERNVPNPIDAEDILQEIFIKIHKNACALEKVTQIEKWVFTVARNTLADYYRKKYRENRRRNSLDASTPEGHLQAVENLANLNDVEDVHEEVLSWLIPMIGELPEKYRKPLLLADVEGLSQKEVARRLGLSLSGTKSRIQRARVLLGQVLKACCEVNFGPDGRAVEYHKKSPRSQKQT